MFAEAVRVDDLPHALRAKLKSKGGRSISTNPKVSTTIRFDADVLNTFKSSGKGWQTRMNDALKEWLAERSN